MLGLLVFKVYRFSFIELLVVVFVMLLILACLIPTFNRVAETAKGIKCIFNLKQVGYAFAIYTTQNNLTLPHEDNGTTEEPSGYVWYQKILPYMGEEGAAYRQEEAFLEMSNTSAEMIYSYKFNSRLEDYKGKNGEVSAPFRSLKNVPYPSKTVLLFDGRVDKAPYKYLSYGIWKAVHARHNHKAGILFLDWSAKLVESKVDENSFWLEPGGVIWEPEGF